MTWERTLADLVEQRTGIALSPRQLRPDVRRQIDARIQALGLDGPPSWVWHLARAPAGSPELAWLIETVTVGYSYFFRDADQLQVAIEVLAARGPTGGPMQIWCAGCSTGQEAWSLAILADEAGLNVQILGTDLNPSFLEVARAGRYSSRAVDRIPDTLRSGLVDSRGEVRVRTRLHGKVRFDTHNLVHSGPYPVSLSGQPFDLILCRNVFIYFSDPVRERVSTRLARALAPAGWLFLGPGETLEGLDVPLETRPWGRRLGYVAQGRAPATGALPTSAPLAPPDDPLAQAIALVDQGDLESALPVLRTLSRRLDDARTWTALAHLLARCHDFDAALEACASARRRDPLFVEAHLAEGLVHRKLGALSAAERALRQALFLDPDCWVAGFLLASVYARQGRDRDRQGALTRARRALQRGKGGPGAVPLMGLDDLDPDRARDRHPT